MNRRKGSIIIPALIALLILIAIGISLLGATSRDQTAATEASQKEQALAAAEAGIEQCIWLLNNTNGTSWRTTTGSPYTGSMSGSLAQYSVVVENATVSYATITLVSTGTPLGNSYATVTVVAQLSSVGSSTGPWNNAVCGGSSPALDQFNNQNNVHGSVLILGEGEPMDSTNTFYYDNNENGNQDAVSTDSSQLPVTSPLVIYNTYSGIENSGFSSKVPTLPTDASSGKYSLSSAMRMQHGQVKISNGMSLGEATPDASATGFVPAKNSITGSFVGQGGNPYPSQSPGPSGGGPYSDNGYTNKYDLALGAVRFPSILYPVTSSGSIEYPPAVRQGGDYADWIAYISTISADYTGNLSLTTGNYQSTTGAPGFNFTGITTKAGTTAGTGLKWYKDPADGNSDILEIHGIIHVSGSVTIGQNSETVLVRGSGTIVSGGTINHGATAVTVSSPQDINLVGNILSDGTISGGGGMPTNVCGFLAPGSINVKNGPNYMGAFFAENSYIENSAVNVAGSIVCSLFHKTNGVNTGTFYVPALLTNMPPGMPGAQSGGSGTSVKVVNFQVLGQ